MKKTSAKKAKPTTIVTDKKLIKAVADELNSSSAPLILSKLQDLEKAIYHLAGRVKDIGDTVSRLEQISVGMSTTMEEVLHDLEAAESADYNNDYEPPGGNSPLN
jgi:hypothetical protein